jgi:short-subunit dehydrogenase
VTYVAPRTTRTPINSSAVYRMAEALRMNLDAPETVAARIVAAMVRNRKDCYLGWPESLLVRINGLLPRLVDRAVRKQIGAMREFAVKA